MRKFLLMAAALVMAVCSCSQDEVLENVVSAPEGSFKAVIENVPTTRTSISEDYKVIWKAGDKVSINGKTYTAATGGSTSTILKPVAADAEPDSDGKYTAYYPASMASNPGIPTLQKYVDGTNASLPMKAVSESESLSFQNMGAVLAVTVTPTNLLTKVKSIRVSPDASSTYTLSSDEAITLSGAKTFHIAVPAGTYQDLDITVSDGSNGYSMVTKSGQDIVMERNKLYPVNFDAQSRTSDYLTLTALEDGSKVGFTSSSSPTSFDLHYSTDDGDTWNQVTSNFTDIALNKGESVWFKGENESLYPGGDYVCFAMEGSIKASGNIMSLLDGDNPGTEITGDYAFEGLFKGCSALVDAKDLYLPATTLDSYCYAHMFANCNALKTAPELPATTLADNCYKRMFGGCSALESAPALLATTLSTMCYYAMFDGSTAMKTAPELPATTLAENCYSFMFSNCSALESAPELPATTLNSFCYQGMFSGCTALEVAPELPATTLADYCYDSMFSGCTALEVAPELPATTLADYCYYSMFIGCTALEVAPELPATTLTDLCYVEMFNGCEKLASVTMLATDVTATDCLFHFLEYAGGNATNPTLYVNAAMTEDETIIAAKGNFMIQAAD